MKSRKLKLLATIIGILCLVLVLSPLTGCGGADEITISKLTSNPEDYNGKTVTVTAFYFDAFEMMALCDSLKPSTTTPGYLAPQEPLIWVEGGMPVSTRDKLYTQSKDIATGYDQHYGKLKVTGKFQAGGQFGHLGGYKYQLSVTEVQLLDWSPTPAK